MALQHTPLPWVRDKSSGYACDIRASNGRKIALLSGFGKSHRPESPISNLNADFVVKAVNNHYELLKVLEDLVRNIDNHMDYGEQLSLARSALSNCGVEL